MPRKSVEQMVKEYEENIIPPPVEFRDDCKLIAKPRTVKPIPTPRTKITKLAQALKDSATSFEVDLRHNKDPALLQKQNARKAIEYYFKASSENIKGFKFNETLKVTFKKSIK